MSRNPVKPRKEPMNERQLASFIEQKVHRGLNRQGSGMSEMRKKSFDRYIGKDYGVEVPGNSSIITRKSYELVEWALSQIIPAFLSSDKIVEFTPTGPEDEEQARQETEVVNYFLTKKNDGFMFLFEFIKDSLMYPNGYARVTMDERETKEEEEYTGLTDIGLAQLISQYEAEYDDLEVVEHSENLVGDPGAGSYVLFDVKLKYTRKEKVLKVETVPGEELLLDNDLLSLNIDEGDFVCHRVRRSYSYLVEQGFSQKQLDNVPLDESYDWNDERVNRHYYEEETPSSGSDDDDSMREYWVHDCSVLVDYDGDGIAERRHVIMIGREIFLNEVDSYQPYVSMSAIPMQHKHNGMGMIETVMDLDIIDSTLTRQLLTNIYKINQPTKYVGRNFKDEDADTMSQLRNPENEFVDCIDPMSLRTEDVTDLAPLILPALQRLDDLAAKRTGITTSTAVDANVLQNTSATAADIAATASSKRVEQIVRIFAETGIKQAMIKAHRLLRENQDKPLTVKLRGNWVEIDPSHWRERTDLTVNVGLGTNDKTKDIMVAEQLLQKQMQAGEMGLSDKKKVFNGLEKWVQAAGLQNADLYFTRPPEVEPPPPPPPPDPQMIMMQEQMRLAADEQNRRNQETQAKLQMEMQELQVKHRMEMEELQHKQRMDMLKADQEAANQAMEQDKQAVQNQKTLADTDLSLAKTRQTEVDTQAQIIENQAVKDNIVVIESAEVTETQ